MCSRWLLCTFILLSSCSVFEDRVPCPVFVTLDCSCVDSAALADCGITELKWYVEYPDSSGGQSGVWQLYDIPREEHLEIDDAYARISVIGIAFGKYRPYAGVNISEGNECPLVYSWTDIVDTGASDVRDTVRLHKQFAKMTLILDGTEEKGTTFKIYGSVCGYDTEWYPVPGQFLVPVNFDDVDNRCTVSLPRQFDNSLKLLQYKNGVLIRDYCLGDYIFRSGYDWNADDLDDFSVEIECDGSVTRFKISQWKKTQTFTIVL